MTIMQNIQAIFKNFSLKHVSFCNIDNLICLKKYTILFFFKILWRFKWENYVLRVGIEPTLQMELDFESSASTSFATEA